MLDEAHVLVSKEYRSCPKSIDYSAAPFSTLRRTYSTINKNRVKKVVTSIGSLLK